MSRWLKSVNNLLETLDGQAETVRENTDLIVDGTITQLLEKGQQAVAGLQRKDSEESSGYYEEEEEEEYEYEEEIIEEDSRGGNTTEDEDIVSSDAGEAAGVWEDAIQSMHRVKDDEEAVSIGVQQQGSHDEVSEISFTSEYTEEVLEDEIIFEEVIEEVIEEEIPGTSLKGQKSIEDAVDTRPKTSNPFESISGRGTEMNTNNNIISEKSNQKLKGSTRGSQHSSSWRNSNSNRTSPRGSPRFADESPRPPRRSVDALGSSLPAAPSGFLEDADEDIDASHSKSPGVVGLDEFAPPRLPTRQSSENSQPPKATMKDPKPMVPTSNPIQIKDTKEYQKLLAKIGSLQHQLSKTTNELKASEVEVKKLHKQINTLDTKLETANTEINAQSEELRRAGERMEKDRKEAEEEREDILDEHDDEIEQLKETHDSEMNKLREQYEKKVADLTETLEREEKMRMQEGGDWTKELQDAVGREQEALKRLNEVEGEKTELQSTVLNLEKRQTTLQGELDSALQSVKSSIEREREAESKLDAAKTLHARQLGQRQAREAELEKTVFDLGTALTAAQQSKETQVASPTPFGREENYKEKYEGVAEELDNIKVQFNMETQRREALQQELHDISKERSDEASLVQSRQRQQDEKVADLEATISRLQTSFREQRIGGSTAQASAEGRASQLSQELEQTKVEVGKLSDQLVRHQGLAESSKAEILALKGRLRMATSRADEAERSLASAQNPQSTGRLYDVESGGAGLTSTKMRRRIKGGARGRFGSSAVRSVRSVLRMGPGRQSPAMEQVATTMDALDRWMVETGSFMRHEPFARLGFLLYLITLHLWSFALVVFHTTEQPHADFGSLDNNPRHWRQHT